MAFFGKKQEQGGQVAVNGVPGVQRRDTIDPQAAAALLQMEADRAGISLKLNKRKG